MVKHIYIFFLFVFSLHIVSIFYPSEILSYILGILSIIMLVLSYGNASRLFQLLGGSFLLIGGALFFTADLSIMDVIPFMADNLSLLALLAMLPWMNAVVSAGRFDKLMQHLLRGNVSGLGALYQRSTTAMMSLTAFLNISSATIAQDVLVDNLKPVNKKIANKFIMMTTLRGYSLALPWSPLEVLLAMSIFITGVNYGELLPWMLLITVLMFVLDSVWGRWYFNKFDYPKPKQTEKVGGRKRQRIKIMQLSISLVIFLALVVLFGNLLDVDFLLIVTLLVFPFACIWAYTIKRWKSFWAIGLPKWKSSVNNMHNFIVLFVTIALFTNTLKASPILSMIEEPILYVSDYPILILIMIQLLFVVLSMFGVHPLATMGIISGLSGMLMDILSPLSLAVILAIGGISTVPVGTYGLVVTITSMSLRQSPYLITYYNLIYSFIFGLIGILTAYFLI